MRILVVAVVGVCVMLAPMFRRTQIAKRTLVRRATGSGLTVKSSPRWAI